MLTIKDLKDMTPDTIFAKGVIVDSPDGINMMNSGRMLKWVACRGGIWDWAIYCCYDDEHDYDYAKSDGEKVTSEENIKKLVTCDDEAFKMYRY